MVRTITITFLATLLLFFTASDGATAQSFQSQPPAVERAILGGIDAIYSMEFERADSIFSACIAGYPKEPTAYFYHASVYLWKYMFNKEAQYLNTFISRSEKTIAVAESILDRDENNTMAKTILGGTYGYRALANIYAENHLKASWDVRSCYDYLGDVLERNPQEYEAYLGMGIFQFAIGTLPSAAEIVLNIVGLKGSRDKGLRQLEIAAEKSKYSRNDARFILGAVYIYYFNNYDKGIGYIKGLLQKYPNNVPLLYTMGNIEAQLRKMDHALRHFNKVLSLNNPDFTLFTGYAHYRKGEALFRLNRFNEAKRSMQAFVLALEEKALRCMAYFRMGECYELNGERENALKAYRQVLKINAVSPEDRWAKRKAQEYIDRPMDAVEIQLIRGTNCMESHRFAEGDSVLNALLKHRKPDKEQVAEARYHMGEAKRQAREYTAAIEDYQAVIKTAPVRERWLIPWAYFRLSQVYYQIGKRDVSRAYLEKSKVYSDYDFAEWLHYQIDRDITTLY